MIRRIGLTGTFDAKGFLGYDDSRKEITVSFKGSTSIENWIANLNFAKADFDFPGVTGAKVQGDWFSMAESLWFSLELPLRELLTAKPDYKLLVTGHSLGATHAELVSLFIKLNLDVLPITYTYGAPRVGNGEYEHYWSSQMGMEQYRLTNTQDPVPSLPPMALKFHHRPREVAMDTIHGKAWKICDGSGEDPTCHDQYVLPVPLNIFEHLWYLDTYLGIPCI
jgi:hypothetical protein